MKRIVCVLICLAFISCEKESSINEPSADNFQSDLQSIMDSHWNNYTSEKTDFPGGYAMQIIKGNAEYFVSTGSLKNADNKIHFRAASTTKTFTAAGILLLHQRGLLNINHFITDIIPGKTEPYVPSTSVFDIPFKNQITIKQLMQNRAGVFDLVNTPIPDSVAEPYAGFNYIDYILEGLGQATHTFTTEEMVGILAKHKLCYFAPGEGFHYSDTGFNLLGYIISRITGQNYSDFITENLLIPNGLMETTFPSEGTDITIPAEYAPGYVYYQGETFDVTESNRSCHLAEGNVVTTPNDLTKWIMKLLKGEAGIDRKYIEFLMKDCQPTYESHQYYGLGCVFTPGLGFGHNGGTAGYWTTARYDSEMDLAFVIFCNVWDYDAILSDIYTQIFDMYDVVIESKEIFK